MPPTPKAASLTAEPGSRTRVGFVISHMLGFVTYAANLKASLEAEPSIEPEWILVPPSAPDVWERFPQFTLKVALRAASTLRRQRRPLDCLFFCTQVLAMFSLDWMRKIPTVLSLDATPRSFDEVVGGYGRKPAGKMGALVKDAWNRRLFDAAHTVVAWNEWTARSLREDYNTPPDKVKVIYQGIDTALWSVPRREVGSEETLRALFVGGDFERKGGFDLLDAARELRGLEIDIVSNDPAAQPSERVRVHRNLAPNSEPLRALFREADVFVLPTRGDTNPWVILEAMASGLPVVSTRVGAIPEQVADGETGLVVPPRDTRALIEALRAVTRDPARRLSMGNAARARAEALFDARANDRKLFDVLRAAARSRRRSGAPR